MACKGRVWGREDGLTYVKSIWGRVQRHSSHLSPEVALVLPLLVLGLPSLGPGNARGRVTHSARLRPAGSAGIAGATFCVINAPTGLLRAQLPRQRA